MQVAFLVCLRYVGHFLSFILAFTVFVSYEAWNETSLFPCRKTYKAAVTGEKKTQWETLLGAPCGTSQHQSMQVSCMGILASPM